MDRIIWETNSVDSVDSFIATTDSPIPARIPNMPLRERQRSSLTEVDISYSDPAQLTYFLELLRPQSPNSTRNSISDSEEEQIDDISSSQLDMRYSPRLYATPPTPDNLAIDPIDSNYLQFFFIQSPMFLLFEHLFPSAPSAFWDLASQHPPALQSILAVSAQHADMVAGRKPTRALIHLSKCLPQIQEALTKNKISEGDIAAVYCLTRLYFARRERVSARNHLHGLYLMLEAYQEGSIDPSSPMSTSSTSGTGYRFPRAPSPFMMFLWRIAIQMDLGTANCGQELVFPPPAQGQESFHRTWISRIASPANTEWALAEFALDDLHHHTMHLEQFAIKIRSSPLYDPSHEEVIREEVEKLWDMHKHWKTREIVSQAARIENLHRQMSGTSDAGQFLHYGPPLTFLNEMFTRMLLYHTERIIQIDCILVPSLRKPSERRVRAAVEVCRIIAGVKNMNEGKGIGQYFQGLNHAGIVFDPFIFPDEFKWVVEKLFEVDRLSGYDSGRNLVATLTQAWDSGNPWETYRRLSGRSVPS